MGDYEEELKKKHDEQIEAGAGGADLISRTLDFTAAIADADGGGGEAKEMVERGAAVTALPGDVLKEGKGIGEVLDGRPEGFHDTVAGGAGVVGDILALGGVKPGANIAGAIKSEAEIENAQRELATGVNNDNGQQELQGVHDMLVGVGDAAGSAPEKHVSGVGKALGFGMAVGDAIAPTVFGDNKNGSSDVQQSDGTYVPSTGNGAIDWIAGTGKYTNSRLDADGTSAEDRSPTMGDVGNDAVKNAMRANLAKLDDAIANADSDEERARLTERRAQLQSIIDG